MPTIIQSLNTWSGGAPGFHTFLKANLVRSDYLALQEVHSIATSKIDQEVTPRSPGSRKFGIRPHLKSEIRKLAGPKWHLRYAPHIRGMHDCETDPRLFYGQCSLVRKDAFSVVRTISHFIHGHFDQFNSEKTDGLYCSRVAIGHLLQPTNCDDYLAVVNVHGMWTRQGKVVLPERFEQNKRINELVVMLQQVAPIGSRVHVIVIGDLNYTSEPPVLLTDLRDQPCFGDKGGVILNHEFNVTETRTSYYEKPCREADFAIVSQSLLPYVEDFTVFLEGVPSDHGLLELTINL